jgi:phage terminase Nu1 subunit (DNA packaging protein)
MRVIGQQGIADLFGVSRETIDTWQHQGLPVAARGGAGSPSEYDSEPCIRWRVEHELQKVLPNTPTSRLALAKADAIEMDNAERRGLLIPAALLEPKLNAAFVNAREKWAEVQHRLARELPADVDGRAAVLQAEFESFLISLARWPHAHEGVTPDPDPDPDPSLTLR